MSTAAPKVGFQQLAVGQSSNGNDLVKYRDDNYTDDDPYDGLQNMYDRQGCADLCSGLTWGPCMGFVWIGSGPYINTCWIKSALQQPFQGLPEPNAQNSNASGVYAVLEEGSINQYLQFPGAHTPHFPRVQ